MRIESTLQLREPRGSRTGISESGGAGRFGAHIRLTSSTAQTPGSPTPGLGLLRKCFGVPRTKSRIRTLPTQGRVWHDTMRYVDPTGQLDPSGSPRFPASASIALGRFFYDCFLLEYEPSAFLCAFAHAIGRRRRMACYTCRIKKVRCKFSQSVPASCSIKLT
jgi:hypothetical protein